MNILLIASRFPWPPRRGDQARALQVAELLALDHRVTLLVPEPPGPERPAAPAELPYRLETYRRSSPVASATGVGRALLRGLPLQSGLFRNRDLKRRLRRLAPASDLAILQLVRLARHLPDLGATPVVVDLVDSLALSTEKRSRLDCRMLRPALRWEARSLARWEVRLVREASAAMVVSGRDREAIARDLPPEAAARLHVVPLAVPAPEPVRPADRPGSPLLVVTGNLGYFPTAEGLLWFLAEVWPRLRARRPELQLLAAGDRPSARLLRALAGAGARLEESPSELRPILERATVALAPMRGGAGQPMKILEAWAAGVPVVATPWAAAGTTGRPGDDLLVAGDPDAWCRSIECLVDDPGLRDRIATSARRRLAADYSRHSVGRRLEMIVAEATASGAGP
ncbi:MAG TPA: glycosyltransferase family 4 protein [Thermoanaerobaculia bacterium]|nr:glycosyltransferase family 4 protein [Thermoanaerobaculia bacterium]